MGPPPIRNRKRGLEGLFVVSERLMGDKVAEVSFGYIRLSEHDAKTSMTVVDGGGLKSTLPEML